MKLTYDLDEIPENAVLGVSILVQVFYDESGTAYYALERRGEAESTTYIGLVEMIKHKMLREVD